jgi:MEMO1 family protein
MDPKKIIHQSNSKEVSENFSFIKYLICHFRPNPLRRILCGASRESRNLLVSLIGLITVLIIIFCILIFSSSFFKQKGLSKQNTYQIDRTQEAQIYQAIEIAQKNPLNFHQEVFGAVVTHHLLAAYITAQVFENISHQNPKTIIIIGPNHFEAGESKIITGDVDWETPFGTVKSDKQLTRNLVESGIIENNRVINNDHSIGAIVPFIGKYIPGAKVLPLIIKRSISKAELSVFKNILTKIINQDIVVIASVDFSHYLKSIDAESNDVVTESLINNYDYQKLLTLGSDFIDSPGSIVLLEMLMTDLGKTNITITAHDNSGRITRNLDTETTSYFSMLFY